MPGPTSSAKTVISSLDLQIAFELNVCCSMRKFGLVFVIRFEIKKRWDAAG